MNYKLELVIVPVTDVDRAKAFYVDACGFTLDVDHQRYSFDSFLKLIEDRFIDGRRLDGENWGWPDSRPTVREEVPGLGDLRDIFDFEQEPLPPLVLDPEPG